MDWNENLEFTKRLKTMNTVNGYSYARAIMNSIEINSKHLVPEQNILDNSAFAIVFLRAKYDCASVLHRLSFNIDLEFTNPVTNNLYSLVENRDSTSKT